MKCLPLSSVESVKSSSIPDEVWGRATYQAVQSLFSLTCRTFPAHSLLNLTFRGSVKYTRPICCLFCFYSSKHAMERLRKTNTQPHARARARTHARTHTNDQTDQSTFACFSCQQWRFDLHIWRLKFLVSVGFLILPRTLDYNRSYNQNSDKYFATSASESQ